MMADFYSATKKLVEERALVKKKISILFNGLKDDKTENLMAFEKYEAKLDCFLAEIRSLNSQIEDICIELDIDEEEDLHRDTIRECVYSKMVINDLSVLASINGEKKETTSDDPDIAVTTTTREANISLRPVLGCTTSTADKTGTQEPPSVLRHYSVWTSEPITISNSKNKTIRDNSNKGSAELEKEFQSAPKISKPIIISNSKKPIRDNSNKGSAELEKEFQPAPKIYEKLGMEVKSSKRNFYSKNKHKDRLNEKKPNEKDSRIRQKNGPKDKINSGSKKYRPNEKKPNEKDSHIRQKKGPKDKNSGFKKYRPKRKISRDIPMFPGSYQKCEIPFLEQFFHFAAEFRKFISLLLNMGLIQHTFRM